MGVKWKLARVWVRRHWYRMTYRFPLSSYLPAAGLFVLANLDGKFSAVEFIYGAVLVASVRHVSRVRKMRCQRTFMNEQGQTLKIWSPDGKAGVADENLSEQWHQVDVDPWDMVDPWDSTS